MIVRQKKKEIGVSILPIYFEKVTGDYYMRKLRKVIAMALMSAVVIAGTPAFNNDVKAVTINSDAGAITQWQTNAITNPVAGKLVPAGYVDNKWTSQMDLGETKKVISCM